MKIGNNTVKVLKETREPTRCGFGTNDTVVIEFDGIQYRAFLQGMINIWAFDKRPTLSSDEGRELDAYINSELAS